MVTSAPCFYDNLQILNKSAMFISSVLFLKNERCRFGAVRHCFIIDVGSSVLSDSVKSIQNNNFQHRCLIIKQQSS